MHPLWACIPVLYVILSLSFSHVNHVKCMIYKFLTFEVLVVHIPLSRRISSSLHNLSARKWLFTKNVTIVYLNLWMRNPLLDNVVNKATTSWAATNALLATNGHSIHAGP